MTNTRTSTGKRTSALWLYNPWLDLIVGCGAWSAPLLLLAYFSVASSTLQWSLVFYVLALFFNYPHYMATIYRAYHRESDFQRYRIFTVHITLLVALTVVLTHFWPRALPWIFTLYLTFSPWHYSGQNFGLFMMFARRAGVDLERNVRDAIYASFLLSYGILFLTFHTGPSTDPLFLSLNLPGSVSSALQIVLALAFVGCSVFGLSRLLGQRKLRDLLPSLTLFATQFTWFLLPTVLALGEKLRIPQSRYSTGALAVMHSAQYLWITSYYARREAVAEGKSSWRPFAYFAILMAGGIALFVPGPWIATHVFHFDFTRSFLIFTALVNLHHFILDGAIWKLREGRIAAILIQSQASVTEAAGTARSRLVKLAGWIAGPAYAARALRVCAALTLLAWASIDQVRYYFALQDDKQDLQRAAQLTAYDSSLQLRLAHKAMDQGQKDEAIQAWKQAMAADPSNPTPRNLYLQYLIGEKKFADAYAVADVALRSDPTDAQLTFNRGTLALELGRPGEAVENWKKAIALNANLADAHLYLGAELDREGKPAEALPQYQQYLALVAKQGPESRPPASQVVTAALRLADDQQHAGQAGPALHTFELARQLAAQTKEARLESIASVSQAGLEAHEGRSDDARQLYQRAIFLDDSLGDRASEAADLEQLALLLAQNPAQANLAYAALLRADELRGSTTPAAEITALRKTLEKTLGKEAAAIRHDPAPVLARALAAKLS
jgi:tetratricopeptide (TPR) repeat protein